MTTQEIHTCNIKGCKSFDQHIKWIKSTPIWKLKLLKIDLN